MRLVSANPLILCATKDLASHLCALSPSPRSALTAAVSTSFAYAS